MASRLPYRNVDLSQLRPEPPAALHYDSRAEPWQPWQEGPGYIDKVSVSNPAAGSEMVYTTPGDVWERIISARMRLTASAVVATRVPFLLIIDGNGSEVMRMQTNNTLTAGNSLTLTFADTVGAFVAAQSGNAAVPFFRMILRPGWQLKTVTALLDAGDQWSGVALIVERWLNRPRRLARR